MPNVYPQNEDEERARKLRIEAMEGMLPTCTCHGTDFVDAINACPRHGINQSVIRKGEVMVVASSNLTGVSAIDVKVG